MFNPQQKPTTHANEIISSSVRKSFTFCLGLSPVRAGLRLVGPVAYFQWGPLIALMEGRVRVEA